MTGILEFIDPAESVPLLVLIGLVLFITNTFTRPDSAGLTLSRRASAAAFFAYAGLAVVAWRPAGASDLLNIAFRAALAAGAVYAGTRLILGVVTSAMADPLGAVRAWWRQKAAQAESLARERRSQREQLERERREREEADRMRPIQELERRRQAEEAARRERERYAKSDEARAEVIGFYQQHVDEIADTMPEPLFRTKLQTSLPQSIDPDQAWPAAERLIGEIQTLLVAATATQRERLNEQREGTKEIQRLRLLIRREEKDLERLLQSPGYDAEVCEPEVKAMQQRIADLKDELDILENEETRR